MDVREKLVELKKALAKWLLDFLYGMRYNICVGKMFGGVLSA